MRIGHEWTTAVSSTDWPEEAAGLDFHLVFLGQQRLGINSQNRGSVLFILTCEWVRVYSQIQDSHTHTLKHTPGHVCVCACALALLLHSCQWAAEGALHMVTDGSATWSTGELLLLDYLCGGAALCITTGSSFFTLIMGWINVLLPRDDFVAGSFSIFILILITISFLFKGMFLQVTVEEIREWLWERVGIDPGQFIFCCPWWVALGEIASLSPVIVASELKRSKKERGGRRKPLV